MIWILTIFFILPNSGGIVHSQQFGYPSEEACVEFGNLTLDTGKIFGYTCQEGVSNRLSDGPK